MEEEEKFKEFMLKTKRLSDKTIELYLTYYKRFNGKDLNQESVNSYLEECGNNGVVRGFMKAYLYFRNLHKLIDLPPKPSGRPRQRLIRPITQNEIETFSNYLHRLDFQKGLMFDLIYQGALRQVEVPSIRINSFYWREWEKNPDKFIKLVVLGKNNKERVVLINPETATKLLMFLIEIHKVENEEQLDRLYKNPRVLFKVSLDKLYKVIKYNSIKALNRDIRPHELRHQRATELEKKGVPVQEIKVYLGHSNLATTEKYLHKTESEAISNIQDRLSS